jgi:hypothetical protein
MGMIRSLCSWQRRAARGTSPWVIGLERGYWMNIGSVLPTILCSWPALSCASDGWLSSEEKRRKWWREHTVTFDRKLNRASCM